MVWLAEDSLWGRECSSLVGEEWFVVPSRLVCSYCRCVSKVPITNPNPIRRVRVRPPTANLGRRDFE